MWKPIKARVYPFTRPFRQQLCGDKKQMNVAPIKFTEALITVAMGAQ